MASPSRDRRSVSSAQTRQTIGSKLALMPATNLRPPPIRERFRIPIFFGAERLRARLCAEARANAAKLLRRTREAAAESAGKARAAVPARLREKRLGRD